MAGNCCIFICLYLEEVKQLKNERDKKRRTPNNGQSKRSGKTEKRERKPHQTLSGKENESKHLHAKSDSSTLVSDSNTGSEPSEVYENLVIHYVDDVNRFEEAPQDPKANAMIAKVNNEILDDRLSDLEKVPKQGKEEEPATETIKDSVSLQGDSLTADDEKVERVSRVPKSISNKDSSDSSGGSRVRSNSGNSKSQTKAANSTAKIPAKSNKASSRVTSKNSLDKNSKDMKLPTKPSSDSSEGASDDKPVEDIKEIEVLDEASNGTQSIASDNETVDAEENGEHEDEAALNQRIEEMEMRIGKLEEELREVAALEVSLYSVVPEHGSSAHKVHTPARRLSRLYIHACKNWTQDKRATIAKNSVSGLVLIAKSCGNDVPRQVNLLAVQHHCAEGDHLSGIGSSRHSSPLARFAESNGGSKKSEGKPTTLKWKGSSGSKQANGFMQLVDDWQETGTYTAALEKVESWIFSRIVESVWWQALTPHMQSPSGNFSSNKSFGRLLGPALGDQQQGSFSVNLWKNAFRDAFQRLCPVRAGGHECGCLPIIARMVMEQCVARLDIAMFNAILRESAHEIPTDPVSDPILDAKVLPIPAGDLSFGSGAQLKNSVKHCGVEIVRRICKKLPLYSCPVVYTPPSSADVAEKVAEVGSRSQLSRNVSTVQRKGYTSDEELEELDSPLTSIIEKLPSSPSIVSNGNGNGNTEHAGYGVTNARYELLREVWSAEM
ncbi:hypothetical protein GH714_032194 [Hevea brasiliensis]|uniref:Dilute domain-containing protein n=1 Tax=Hevea brasiliensis TaxID=3981 RepID=A0A6A6M4T2_HEVBR|nr:hypothetical protein GH714_032194 [Hevea brasiliensis]